LSANAHHGCDQQTLEARAYAVARHFKRYWSTPWSASSARSTCSTANKYSAPGWKTTFAASCWACRWGCDVCYTNHAEADPDDMDSLMLMLGAAGCNFIMGVRVRTTSCSTTKHFVP